MHIIDDRDKPTGHEKNRTASRGCEYVIENRKSYIHEARPLYPITSKWVTKSLYFYEFMKNENLIFILLLIRTKSSEVGKLPIWIWKNQMTVKIISSMNIA